MALNSLFCADVPLSNYSLTVAKANQNFSFRTACRALYNVKNLQIRNCPNSKKGVSNVWFDVNISRIAYHFRILFSWIGSARWCLWIACKKCRVTFEIIGQRAVNIFLHGIDVHVLRLQPPAVWQWQPKLVQTVQKHCPVWIYLDT